MTVLKLGNYLLIAKDSNLFSFFTLNSFTNSQIDYVGTTMTTMTLLGPLWWFFKVFIHMLHVPVTK